MEQADRIAELSTLFTFLADSDFAGYSPLYERIARHLASRPDLLAIVDDAAAPNSRRGRVPVLFLAALHDLALRRLGTPLDALFDGAHVTDDGFAAVIDAAIRRDHDTLVATMRTHSVQTNEVGRTAAIVAGLAELARSGALTDREVALVEIGPSAGLNLYPDRWHVDYFRDGSVIASSGPAESSVRLSCELRGPATPPSFAAPPIAVRTGVDPAPIDASDPEQARWLRACVWPDVPDRPQRLSAAIEAVAIDPPTLVRGDAVTDLAPLVRSIDAALLPVVVSTWAMAYISADGRATLRDALEDLGSDRDLALLTLEEPRFTTWLTDPGPLVDETYVTGDGTPTMLGLRVWTDGVTTSTPLALSHPHGKWMRWLAEEDR